jgi:hypothetical protein
MAPVFVDEAKKEVWTIDNPGCGEGLLRRPCDGDRDRRCGKKSVHIDSIAEAK